MKMEEGVCKYIDVSTGHITERDDKLFMGDSYDLGSAIIATGYGYFVYICGDRASFAANLKDMKQAGYSAAARRVLSRAHRAGCDWVKFDRDAIMYEDLPRFDW
jgi:hypothetical protein